MLMRLMTTCMIAILLNIGTVNCLERNDTENEGRAIELFQVMDKQEESDKKEKEPMIIDSLNDISLTVGIDSDILDFSHINLEKELNELVKEEEKERLINSIINEGLLQLGKPYVFGANGGESFDCSMLVKHSMESKGISCPRTSREQRQMMKYIEFKDLQRGDFIFWHKGSIDNYKNVRHVAIYLGNGKMLQATPPKVMVSNVVKGKVKEYNISYGRYDYSSEI